MRYGFEPVTNIRIRRKKISQHPSAGLSCLTGGQDCAHRETRDNWIRQSNIAAPYVHSLGLRYRDLNSKPSDRRSCFQLPFPENTTSHVYPQSKSYLHARALLKPWPPAVSLLGASTMDVCEPRRNFRCGGYAGTQGPQHKADGSLAKYGLCYLFGSMSTHFATLARSQWMAAGSLRELRKFVV